MDLCDTQNLKEFNDGARFILTVIDVFSKYGFARPLLDKKSHTVTDAFVDILEKSNRTPSKIQSDAGVEFTNKLFKAEMKKRGVHFYVTFSENKAAVVERFNRTLKNRMWTYFTYYNTFRFVDILQDLVHGYNVSSHSSLGNLPPVEINQRNQLEVWQKNFAPTNTTSKFKFKVNDTVRISRDKGVFGKGYTHNWSEEYFIIYERLQRNPVVYRLKDLNEEKLDGVFYEHQLQKIKPGGTFPISKIIKRKKQKAFVKWRGWPDSFNSWVPISELKKYG